MGLAQERAIASNFILLEFYFLLALMIEIDRVFGVLQQRFVRLDAVGDIGVDKGVVLEVLLEFLGIVGPQELQEFEQIDDLVVAPVTNVGPRVVRFDGLPFETVFEHAVGVVSLKSGGVEELENHALNELGIGMDQRFPVLEDVAPVSLVIEDFRAVILVAEVDGEPVPRTAGVAVAAAEFQRQVFCTQPLEIEVVVLAGVFLKKEQVEFLWPGGHGFCLLEVHLVVCAVHVGHEVRALDGVVLIEDPATHDVEHRVGEMPNVAAAVGRELQAIASGHQFNEAVGALLDVLQHLLLECIWRLEILFQSDDSANGLPQIRDHHPVFS